jgi:hypothetical protein
MTKKEPERKKYGLLPPKIAESDIWSLGHGLRGSGGSIFTVIIPVKTHSLLALTMIDPATRWFEIVTATNKSETSIQDLFHNTWLARHPWSQFIVLDNLQEENSNVSSNKCVTIMALKPNQSQVTIQHLQANAIIERLHKVVNDNDMLRSFDLENNHENLVEQAQGDNPFDYFLQSTGWYLSY